MHQRTRNQDQGTRGPEDQGTRTREPEDQSTRDHGTTGPEDQRTRGRGEQGPRDQRTRGPEDQGTRGPEDQNRRKSPKVSQTKSNLGKQKHGPPKILNPKAYTARVKTMRQAQVVSLAAVQKTGLAYHCKKREPHLPYVHTMET